MQKERKKPCNHCGYRVSWRRRSSARQAHNNMKALEQKTFRVLHLLGEAPFFQRTANGAENNALIVQKRLTGLNIKRSSILLCVSEFTHNPG